MELTAVNGVRIDETKDCVTDQKRKGRSEDEEGLREGREGGREGRTYRVLGMPMAAGPAKASWGITRVHVPLNRRALILILPLP